MVYDSDSIDGLLADYQADLEQNRSEKYWRDADYTAPTGFGTLHLRPLQVAGDPGGPVEKTWRAYIEVARGFVERHVTDDYLPDVEDAREVIEALVQQIQPTRDQEQDRLTRELDDLATQISILTGRLRTTAVEAVDAGVQKIRVSDTARISRSTLDRWLKDR